MLNSVGNELVLCVVEGKGEDLGLGVDGDGSVFVTGFAVLGGAVIAVMWRVVPLSEVE